MQSSHPQVEQQLVVNWLSRAKRKFVSADGTRHAVIHGSGRYAVAVMNRIDVFLYPTFEEAAAHTSQDPKYRQYDLALEQDKPCRTCSIGQADDDD